MLTQPFSLINFTSELLWGVET